MRFITRVTAIASVLSVTISLTQAQLIPFATSWDVKDKNPVMDAQGLPSGGNIILSDILGTQRSISIFASWTRDITSVESRLGSQKTNTTLLAPLNSALSALPRKPWEDLDDYAKLGEQAYIGDGGSERAGQNLERFVNAHIVPVSPWEEKEKVETLAGRQIWWEMQKDKMLIMPDQIEVEKVAKRVGNGEVWIVKGVVNYSG